VGLFDRWRRRRSSPGQTDQGVFPIFPVAGQDQREEREHERGRDERSDDSALEDEAGGGGGGNGGAGGGNGGGGE
jgi:hypothetical protein